MRTKTFFSLLIACFFYQSTLASVDNKKYCDSIIKVGIKLLYKKEHVTSLELLYEANELARKNKWYKQSFLAQNNIRKQLPYAFKLWRGSNPFREKL